MHKVWHNYFAFCVFILLLAGCTSTRVTNTAVLDHQRQLSEYKGAVEGYIKRAGDCAEEIGAIGERANDLGSEVGRVIKLFDDYQRAVDRFIQEYNQLRSKIEALDKSDDNTGSGVASAYDYEDSGILTILQGN